MSHRMLYKSTIKIIQKDGKVIRREVKLKLRTI